MHAAKSGQWYAETVACCTGEQAKTAPSEFARKYRCEVQTKVKTQSAETAPSAMRGFAMPAILPNRRSSQLWNVSM
jgi:hypothetical protein